VNSATVGDLKLAAPSTTQINGPTRPAQPSNGIPAGSLDEAISALVNLGMKPAEAKRTVETVVAEDSSAAASSEVIIRRSLAVLRGEK
jgi:Holliday junction resolvasome RuvABC DNA-binding subunit